MAATNDDWPDFSDGEIRCSECDGSGEIVTGWEYPEYVSCPSCKGSGRERDFLDEADEKYERYRADRLL